MERLFGVSARSSGSPLVRPSSLSSSHCMKITRNTHYFHWLLSKHAHVNREPCLTHSLSLSLIRNVTFSYRARKLFRSPSNVMCSKWYWKWVGCTLERVKATEPKWTSNRERAIGIHLPAVTRFVRTSSPKCLLRVANKCWAFSVAAINSYHKTQPCYLSNANAYIGCTKCVCSIVKLYCHCSTISFSHIFSPLFWLIIANQSIATLLQLFYLLFAIFDNDDDFSTF